LPYVVAVLVVAGLINASVVAAAPAGSATVRHSGIVTSVDPASGTLTLQEMGPWKSPATKVTQLSIALQPTTTVGLVERSTGVGDGGWPGAYVESPLKPADLRAGDFATVSTVHDGGRLVAVSIDVVTPSNE
jgi:hypothetical protein